MYVCAYQVAPIQLDCYQSLSVILLASGDEVVKFWKVKVGGEINTLLNPSSYGM